MMAISASSAVRFFEVPCNFRVGIGEYFSKVFKPFKKCKNRLKRCVCFFGVIQVLH